MFRRPDLTPSSGWRKDVDGFHYVGSVTKKLSPFIVFNKIKSITMSDKLIKEENVSSA